MSFLNCFKLEKDKIGIVIVFLNEKGSQKGAKPETDARGGVFVFLERE